MLGEHVERAGAEDFGIELALADRVERGARLQIFEAVAGDEDRLAGLVEPVVGAADPLQQARGALGRAHLDDQVDVAPVDAEIEAGGADEAAQPPRGDRRLDLAPRLDRERAVMDADRQILVVHRPQILEDQLGEASRVAEDEGGPVPLDLAHHVLRGPAAAMPRPGDFLVLGQHDRDLGLGARIALDDGDRLDVAMRSEPALIGFGIGDGRRQADAAQARRDRLQPCEREGQQVAALAGREGVDLVDHDGAEIGEQGEAVRMAEQQAQRFGRGQQDLRRPHPLARLAVGGRVAGPSLDPDGEAHLGDRSQQIALHVDRKRLQRRDVERVQTVGRPLDQLGEAGQEAGQRLPRPGRRDQQRALPGPRRRQHFELVPARRPALAGEPADQRLGQAVRDSHAASMACPARAGELFPAPVRRDWRRSSRAARRDARRPRRRLPADR